MALTYSWFESVPDEWTGEMIEVEQVRKLDLHAPAKNFCRFSCGFCPSGANSAETDSDNKQCWKNYNEKMAIIYKEYSGIGRRSLKIFQILNIHNKTS